MFVAFKTQLIVNCSLKTLSHFYNVVNTYVSLFTKQQDKTQKQQSEQTDRKTDLNQHSCVFKNTNYLLSR